MSELKDFTAVFREIQKSLKDIAEHIASQDAHLEQLRLNLHNLRNDLTSREVFSEHQEKQLTQIHMWMGSFSKKQTEISDLVRAMQINITDHRREINNRIRSIESQEEITRS